MNVEIPVLKYAKKEVKSERASQFLLWIVVISVKGMICPGKTRHIGNKGVCKVHPDDE